MAEAKIRTQLQELITELEGYQPGSLIICRLCQAPITDQQSAIEIGLHHQHSYTNPAGIIYTIRCFRTAPGCSISGLPQDNYSWFGGFRWQYADCSQCQQHLGWYYEGFNERSFFGLIANRIQRQTSSSMNL